MATKKKALQAAAGWAASQGAIAPEAVSFDGTNDYLSRTSALTGNANTTTMTISFWAYWTSAFSNASRPIQYGSSSIRFNNEQINVELRNLSNSAFFDFYVNNCIANNTWHHFLICLDSTTQANNKLYIDDVAQTLTWSAFSSDTFFTNTTPYYVGGSSSTYREKGRLAHVYLDHTYRDLSTEANRRLFITEDLKPADNQASLSPILYLPLTDADTAGTNEGTGGDFTVNGTLDTAERGPNQGNCVASELDGSADYLTNSSCSITNSKVFSGSITYRVDANDKYIFMGRRASTGQSINFIADGNYVRLYLTNDSNVQIAKFTIQNAAVHGAHHHLAFCIDTDNQSGSKVFLDGVDTEITFDTFVSGGTFNIVDASVGAQYTGNNKWDGMLGELYLDDAYIDLASDNIFWDADANRPKPVRQVLEETGNTPLIAMPLIGNNAGLNLGTGGNFTVNSGPYTGARGGSEYWARSMVATSNDTYIGSSLSSAVSGASGGSLVVAYKRPTADYFMTPILAVGHSGSTGHGVTDITTIRCHDNGSTMATIRADDGTLMTSTGYVGNNTYNVWKIVFLSLDFTNGTYYITTEGASNSGSFSTGYTFGFDKVYFGWSEYASGNDTLVASAYVADSYIDFSSEANRNLFVDQLGYPKDLTPAIDAGDIPTPVVYMKFDDPDALGTNSGTGGDFTVNGTVIQGADVDP